MQIDPSQLTIQFPPDQVVDSGGKKSAHSTIRQTDRVEFGSAYQKIIDKALLTDEKTDSAAVEEARKLLEKGDLDSAESARLAAESMIRFGL